MISLHDNCDAEDRPCKAAPEWGPWIEWTGGECPIPHAEAGTFQVRLVSAPSRARTSGKAARDCRPGAWAKVTAYRLLKRVPSAMGAAEQATPKTTDRTAEPAWGPWIEWTGGECPIPHVKAGDYGVRWADGSENHYKRLDAVHCPGWAKDSAMIVAYRVKVGAQVQRDEESANDAMLARDTQGALAAAKSRAPGEKPGPREPEAWHLRCAPWTNRFGGWGA